MKNKIIVVSSAFVIIFLLFFLLSNGFKNEVNNSLPINTQPIQSPPTADKSWTLFLSKEAVLDINRVDKRIEGYSTQDKCIEKGILFTESGGSFECAYGCKYKTEYQTEICEKVCGTRGCRE